MALVLRYITDEQFARILSDLNVDSKTEAEQQDLFDRACGDMEGDLVMRFIVPLRSDVGTEFSQVPAYTKSKVLNVLRAKIRQCLGIDNNRNLIVDNTQRYIDVHGKEYAEGLKALLDPKRDFKLRLQPQAESVMPVQTVGVARADNEPDYSYPAGFPDGYV